MWLDVKAPDISKRNDNLTIICKSIGIWDGIVNYVNPNYWCGVKITLDVNPVYVGLERPPKDSKNV